MAEQISTAELEWNRNAACQGDDSEDSDSCAACLGPNENQSDSTPTECAKAGLEENFDDSDSIRSWKSDSEESREYCQEQQASSCKESVEQFVAVEEDEDFWPAPPAFGAEETFQETGPIGFQEQSASTVNTVDALLERILRERTSELDQLQNRSRIVTAGNARDNLSEFFTRNLEPENSASNNRERSLPDDVQNLVQRSIVTSTLRRHAFRSSLEQALASRLPASGNQMPQRLRLSSRSNLSGTSTPLLSSIIESDAASITSSVLDQNDLSDAASDIEQIQRAVNVGVQMLSETIEEDLAQLHHLHVVSSALNTDFRNDLERLVQQRAVSVGGGELVQRFISSLPARQLPPPAARSASRNAQAASSAPMSSRTQLNMTNEISGLKAQIEEMKRMLQMSFEVQMDTQRAIRQEVAAVFGAFMQQMASQAATGMPNHQTSAPFQNSAAVSAGSCVICLENQVDTLLYQCGHMCVCNGCGIQLKIQGHKCPMCRAPIKDVIRAYKAQ